MIETEPFATRPGFVQATPPTKPEVAPNNHASPLEGFLQFVVVVAGIVLGVIVALIIGLATGWIAFAC